MTSEQQRQYFRFPLDIEARVSVPSGERMDAVVNEISLSGCYFGSVWVETAGTVFRLEIRLPNGNWLPLNCTTVHTRGGVGARFNEMTGFEQNLLAEVIAAASRSAGAGSDVDPFAAAEQLPDIRIRRKVYSTADLVVEDVAVA